MSDWADEILHMIKQAVAQQQGDYRPFVYGHVASYDPKLHRIRAMVPSLRDDGDTAVLTGWMPLGTVGVGDGYGVQIAPVGGATLEQPTKGEQVKISVIDDGIGTALGAHLAYTEQQKPPFTDLEPGTFAIKDKMGTYFRSRKDGTLEVSVAKDQKIDITGDSTITLKGKSSLTADGDVNVTAKGAVNIKGASGDVVVAGVSLVHHTHSQPVDGHGDTEAETNPPTAAATS